MDEESLVESLFGVKKEKLLQQADWNDLSTLQSSFEKDGKKKRKREVERKAAWEDEDDEKLLINTHAKLITRKLTRNTEEKVISGKEYGEKLQEQFEKINKKPAWAELPDEEVDPVQDSISKVLFSSESLVEKKSSTSSSSSLLPSGTINIRIFSDANKEKPSKDLVTSIHFHPNSQLMLVSGMDGNLNFFNVKGSENTHVHSVSFSKTPLYSAYFNPTGTCVIASSRQSCFFVHDLGSATTREIFPQKAFFGSNTRVAVKQKEKLRGATVDGSRRELSLERLIVPKYNNGSDVFGFLGSSGYIHLTSLTSFTFISSFKLINQAKSLSFSPTDPYTFFALNNNGILYHLDLRMTGNVVCTHDISSTIGAGTRMVEVAPNGELLAIGCDTGNVGIYSIKDNMNVVNTYIEELSSSSFTSSSSSPSSSYSLTPPSNTSKKSTKKSNTPTFPLPTLLRDFSNLRTPINVLEWNSTSEILAIAADAISTMPGSSPSLRLIHVPSTSVFSNWPTNTTPLGKISCAGFSPSCEYLSVGNHKGRALLYRLKHYKQQ